jgi:hypothetical protein
LNFLPVYFLIPTILLAAKWLENTPHAKTALGFAPYNGSCITETDDGLKGTTFESSFSIMVRLVEACIAAISG